MFRVRPVAIMAILLVICCGCTQRDAPADAYRRSGPAAVTGAYDFGLS